MILANSLINGFIGSNFTGQMLVILQIAGSVLMFATIAGKWKALRDIGVLTRRFLRDITASQNILDYYVQRRPSVVFGVELIYKETCEKLIKLLHPDVRSMIASRTDDEGGARLNEREVELVQSVCNHVMEEEVMRVEYGMSIIATIVALEPMLGLLGTVWGVLDAFAEMGTAGSANLATIAPSISAALVTTVVGLIVAIPGVVAFNCMNAKIRNLTSDIEGFADELMGRIACEYQKKGE